MKGEICMTNPLEGIFAYILSFGLLGLVILILIIAFIMWMIKKSVKNAIVEVVDEDALFDNIKLSVAEGVLLALEQYNNGNQNRNQNERPTE